MVESRKIKVYLNEKPVHVFRGMKVKHLLTKDMKKAVRNGDKAIFDEEGNERGLEGSLTEGEKLYVKKQKKIASQKLSKKKDSQ
jgi:hypothetical protein